jgi:hypothetical protein
MGSAAAKTGKGVKTEEIACRALHFCVVPMQCRRDWLVSLFWTCAKAKGREGSGASLLVSRHGPVPSQPLKTRTRGSSDIHGYHTTASLTKTTKNQKTNTQNEYAKQKKDMASIVFIPFTKYQLYDRTDDE